MKLTLLLIVSCFLSGSMMAGNTPAFHIKNNKKERLSLQALKNDQFVGDALYAPGIDKPQVLGFEYMPTWVNNYGNGQGVVRSGRFFFDKPLGKHFGLSFGISLYYYHFNASFYPGTQYYNGNYTHGSLLHISTTNLAAGIPLYLTYDVNPRWKWRLTVYGGLTLTTFTYGKSNLYFSDETELTEKGFKINAPWQSGLNFMPGVDELGFEFSHLLRKRYSIGIGAGFSPSYILFTATDKMAAYAATNAFPVQFHIKIGRIIRKNTE